MKQKLSRNKLQNFARRWHRRLGVIVGIQFLFWTISGTYFAWFHIENVRGNYDKNATIDIELNKNSTYYPLGSVIQNSKLDVIDKASLITAHNKAVYSLTKNKDDVELYDALTGELMSFGKEDAITIAKNDFAPDSEIQSVHYVTERGGEYAGALPAWRIDFNNLKATHIYVHENTGLVTSRRNAIWRGFDFLWMLHILDFNDRSNFNNWLLKIMSVLGLVSILLGYLLWATTTPLLRKKN